MAFQMLSFREGVATEVARLCPKILADTHSEMRPMWSPTFLKPRCKAANRSGGAEPCAGDVDGVPGCTVHRNHGPAPIVGR